MLGAVFGIRNRQSHPPGYTIDQTGESFDQLTPGKSVTFDYAFPYVVYVLYRNSSLALSRVDRANLTNCRLLIRTCGPHVRLRCLYPFYNGQYRGQTAPVLGQDSEEYPTGFSFGLPFCGPRRVTFAVFA